MNTVGSLLTAYHTALNGNVPGMNIYKLNIPESEEGNYVWLYPEGGQDDNTKSSKVENIVIRVEIVTYFNNVADQSLCEAADEIIKNIIVPTPGIYGLIMPAGLQIMNVTRENYIYHIEPTGTGIIYRKTIRYIHRMIQTS